jgi:hypothetical protein
MKKMRLLLHRHVFFSGLGLIILTGLPVFYCVVVGTVSADDAAKAAKPAAAAVQADSSQQSAYLQPGTPEVGGIRNLCLIYHGQKKRVQWTSDALLPYAAYVDKQGRPQDWLFDSFLFLEFATDAGVSLYHDPETGAKPTLADWQWLADSCFRKNSGLIGLEKAVAQAGETLGEPDHAVNVVISMPLPRKSSKSFGPLPGESKPLDFSREEDRRRALEWYVGDVLKQYGEHDYPHLRLRGFYWTQESIPQADYDFVKWLVGYLHGKGYKCYWIPYYVAAGYVDWKKLGFDAVMLQPNYFFHETLKPVQLEQAAKLARQYGSGVEMEFDGRMMTSDVFRDRYYDYLDAGVKYGWMRDSILGWYDGGGAIRTFLEQPDVGRKYYDDLYRFIKGTYKPSHRLGQK